MSLPTQYNNKNQDPVGALSSALARLQANRPLRELREIAKVRPYLHLSLTKILQAARTALLQCGGQDGWGLRLRAEWSQVPDEGTDLAVDGSYMERGCGRGCAATLGWMTAVLRAWLWRRRGSTSTLDAEQSGARRRQESGQELRSS